VKEKEQYEQPVADIAKRNTRHDDSPYENKAHSNRGTIVAARIVGSRKPGETKKKKNSNYGGAPTNDVIHTYTNVSHSIDGRRVRPFELLSCGMEATIIPIGCTSSWMREGHRRYNRTNVLEYAPIGCCKWLCSTFGQEFRGAAWL